MSSSSTFSSSSSSARAAREHLADELRELRVSAGISGMRFAELAGWRDSSKASKIERGARPASEADVILWCRICGATEQRQEELLADQRAMARMWVTYRQLNRGGLRKAQESVRAQFEQAQVMRVYLAHVVPGLLQTEEYTAAALAAVRVEQQVEVDDVAAAVEERMDRQSVLRRAGKRWVFVMEEQVLWYRSVPREVHAGQLRHLLEVMRWPTVSVGIIPVSAIRFRQGVGVWPEHTFTIVDGAEVNVELVSGYLSVTAPLEVADYERAWERLSGLAAHGPPAAAIIRRVLAALDSRAVLG